jgi:hypothetical protein
MVHDLEAQAQLLGPVDPGSADLSSANLGRPPLNLLLQILHLVFEAQL